MRVHLLALFLFVTIAAAEDARQLDPSKPDDALQIVAKVCGEVPLKMGDSQAVWLALQTLQKAIAPAPAPSAPVTVDPPKAKP